MYMTTDQIRQKYLDFFRERGHTVVRSSSLVPHNDPTLLFTNAGMNQFKDVYLGKEKRPYVRACSAQKCVRAGGKQNDLENVGYTARHHTFFEMLGNFSFGDYFKKEAITYAWTLLTEGYGLPKESLTVTVYDKDDEAYNIWKDVIGVPPERIIRIGDNKGGPFESDNFWQMGDTGPCGPCSEIFYDHGDGIWGGPPGSAEEDGDRYIEIWNIVFMQYNRKADGSFEKLGKPMIDNGLGLERIAAVLQGVHNNYDIDLFVNLEKDAARVLGVDDLKNKSLRVIADHIRSCSFLIADGVLPSNEGRGYVLRRIIRRAVRHGKLLGAKDVFFYKLVDRLAELMGHAYPELIEEKDLIKRTLKKEEELFLKTLDRGLFLLEGELNKLGASKVIPGDVVFKLYDTYGFPTDLTADVVRDRGYTLDMDGFDAEMAKQRANSKKNSRFDVDYNKDIKVTEVTKFTGYDTLQSDATVTGIYKDGAEADSVSTDEKAVLILDSTPFYGEMGGQVGDHGSIKCGENTEFIVEDTKRVGKTIIHIGRVELGEFTKGMKVTACVDPQVRRNIAAHHTATHLLDAALSQTLGNDVVQKGSYVGPDRLHYDYSYSQPLTLLERQKVGALINKWIRQNDEVRTEIMDLDAAKKSGAIALFDEKYEDKVRVVSMGDEPKELCGGTHASRTGDLGVFVLVSDESVASGIRRIEARVGQAAIDYLQGIVRMVVKTAKLMKADNLSIAEKTEALLAKGKAMEKENEALKAKVISYEAEKLCQKAVEINGVKLVAARLEGYDPKDLRTAAEDVVVRLKSGVALLGAVNDGKVSLTAAVSKDLTSKVKAGDLVREAAGYVGGKGGGRPDLAQAGGTKAEGLDEAIASAGAFLKTKA